MANANSPEQFVISGERAALDRAIELIRERGARAVVPLRISIASHSPLMQQAALALAELIDRSPLRDPQVPVVTNIAGQVRTTAEDIRERAGDADGGARRMGGLGARDDRERR